MGISWLICGGESGPNSRSLELGWIRDTIKACRDAHVPVFVKQIGSCAFEAKPYSDPVGKAYKRIKTKSSKGGDPDEWPEDLRVREYPGVAAHG